MFYKIITLRTPQGELSSLPSFDAVDLKPFDSYNKKVTLYTIEGEEPDVKNAFDQLTADPSYLVNAIDEGKMPFAPSESNVWVWKQVARHFSSQTPR